MFFFIAIMIDIYSFIIDNNLCVSVFVQPIFSLLNDFYRYIFGDISFNVILFKSLNNKCGSLNSFC